MEEADVDLGGHRPSPRDVRHNGWTALAGGTSPRPAALIDGGPAEGLAASGRLMGVTVHAAAVLSQRPGPATRGAGWRPRKP